MTAFIDLLSFRKLPEAFLGFAALQISMAFFSNMHGVFINTFLLKATGDFSVALKYNMLVFIAQACVMILSVFFVRRWSLIGSIRLGLVLYSVIYLGIIAAGERMAGSYVVIALIFAAAGGFITLPYGVMLSEFTNDRNRDMAVGFLNMWLGFAALTMPALAGILISLFGGFDGYRVMFAAALAITVFSFYLSTKVAPTAPLARKSNFGTVIGYFFKHRVDRLMFLASALSSVREGVFRFVLSVILYQYLKSEAIVGFNSLICGVAAVLASWAYGRIVKPGNRFVCMTISVTVMAVGSVLMLFNTGALAIVLFGILSALSSIFIVTPQDNYTYLLLQVVKRTRDKRPEYQTIKEFFIAIGRNVGILLTLLMIARGWGYIVPLICVVISQYLMIFVTKLAAIELERSRFDETQAADAA
jgi:YQGE family putative transporter